MFERRVLQLARNRRAAGGAVVIAVCAWAILAWPTAAQDSVTSEFAVASADGREVVVAPSSAGTSWVDSSSGPILGESSETESSRLHVVHFEGQTYRAVTPLDGPASRSVFDPARRKFVALLPSIRVELDDFSRLDSIVVNLGAEGATGFERLGFAVIELPATLHPLEAIEMLEGASGIRGASLRMREPRIQWL